MQCAFGKTGTRVLLRGACAGTGGNLRTLALTGNGCAAKYEELAPIPAAEASLCTEWQPNRRRVWTVRAQCDRRHVEVRVQVAPAKPEGVLSHELDAKEASPCTVLTACCFVVQV